MLYQQILLFVLLMIAVTAQVGSNWRREQLDLLNNLRRQQGLRQLNYHYRLELAAQRHVDDLSSAGVPASHTGTDGSDEGDRATRAGYRWLRIGENAARGQRNVEGVFRSYMNSNIHYRNMIGQHWVDVGFGWNSNGNYWCQVFGTPRASRKGMDDEFSEEDFVFVTGRMDDAFGLERNVVVESAYELVDAVAYSTDETGLWSVSSSVSSSDSEQFAEARGSFSRSEMLNNLNSIRRAAGQRPVALHNQLNTAAQGHSDDMARNRFMSHTGSDGSGLGDRIRRAGISRPGAAAENVAAGQRDVAGVMRSWTNSNGHYRNMIGSYTHVGFGMARGSDGVRRWTQKFANPR